MMIVFSKNILKLMGLHRISLKFLFMNHLNFKSFTELCNYDCIFSPRWTKLHLSEFLDAASQEYYRRGNEALGVERFNKSNW